ncbi:MAG: ATP-binding protein, partial [Egibacteraceae bacterium]
MHRASKVEREPAAGTARPDGQVLTEPLVGRHKELAMLDEALDSLDARSARLLEVVGEPGIGKTSLLGELSARASGRGHLVLSGRAVQPEREAPFGIFVEAVDPHLGEPDAQWRDRVDADCVGLLAKIFPALSGHAGDAVALPGAERYRLHRAVRQLLEQLARPRGLVLILDDLQWSDDASIELLAHLLRHPPETAVLIALAYRPRQASRRLAGAMASAAREKFVQRLDVPALTIDEADELLGQGISAFRRRALYRDSGGNPFYLQALARADHSVCAAREVGGLADVPPMVQAVLLAEIDMLTPCGQLVAQAAAVVGDPFAPELVAAVAGVSHEATLEALDELLDADLVRVDGPRGFRYRHPLVREVTYSATGGGWRLAAHARAADALAARGASAVTRAHHVARAASVGDRAAVQVLLEAAAAMAARAPMMAARWMQVAVDLLPADGAATLQRLTLLIELSRARGVAGELHPCRDTLHEVLRLLPREPSPTRADAVAHCAMAERMLGRHAEGLALLQREWDALPDELAPGTALLAFGLASASHLVCDFEASRDWAGKAAAAALAHGDQPLEAAALAVRALAECFAGQINPARTHLDRATAIIDALPDGELARRPAASAWLGWAEICLDRCDSGLRHLERTLTVVRITGQDYILSHVLAGLALGHQMLGRLGEAAAYAEDAVEAALLLASDDARAMALWLQSTVALLAGDVEAALRTGEQAVEAAKLIKGEWWTFACWGLAHARFASGDPARGIEAAVEGGGGPGLPDLGRPFRPEVYELLTQAELARGRQPAAEFWADLAEVSAARLSLDSATGFAQLARAHLLLAVRD